MVAEEPTKFSCRAEILKGFLRYIPCGDSSILYIQSPKAPRRLHFSTSVPAISFFRVSYDSAS